MFYQKVVKGICGLSDDDATEILISIGIRSNWSRRHGAVDEADIIDVLTEDNLIHHLDDYDEPIDPSNPHGDTYGDVTPFVSTSAGAVQRDPAKRRNILISPFRTALEFATNGYADVGHIFYAYVLTIGKPAVPMRQFAEEVRELHVYTDFRQYHAEGEITAKLGIPAVQIEKMQQFDGPNALADLNSGVLPRPLGGDVLNPTYIRPESLANVRELL